MRDLGKLAGRNSEAWAINARGQIGGWSDTSTDRGSRAVLWRGGRILDLGTLGGKRSEALAINDKGQIVGTSDTATDKHFFLWRNGVIRARVTAINEHNQIVGTSTTKNGQQHAVLWTLRRGT
jgi:probable HAF family extracellular repeat protein